MATGTVTINALLLSVLITAVPGAVASCTALLAGIPHACATMCLATAEQNFCVSSSTSTASAYIRSCISSACSSNSNSLYLDISLIYCTYMSHCGLATGLPGNPPSVAATATTSPGLLQSTALPDEPTGNPTPPSSMAISTRTTSTAKLPHESSQSILNLVVSSTCRGFV
jgi:hypothetical protein